MKYVICIILLSFSMPLYAYEGSPSQQVESFFKDISSGKTNKAIDNLFFNNPSIKRKTSTLTLVKQQLVSINTIFGKNIGNENIHNEKLSTSIVRIVQVAKHELHPVIWEFYFYKPKDKWIVSDAKFNDSFKSLGNKKAFEK